MRQREIKAQREKHGRSIVLEKKKKRKKEKKKKKKCLRLDPKESGEVSIGEEGEGRSFRVERPEDGKAAREPRIESLVLTKNYSMS